MCIFSNDPDHWDSDVNFFFSVIEVASLAFGTYAWLHSRSERQFGSQGSTWPGAAVSKLKASLQWPEQLFKSDFEYLGKKKSQYGAILIFLSPHLLPHCAILGLLDSVLQGSFIAARFSVQQR